MTKNLNIPDVKIGQTCLVEIEGEWYGGTVSSFELEEGKTNWVSVELYQAPLNMKRGDIVTGANDTEYLDYDHERIYPTIEYRSVLLMRSDRGEFGTDTISLGSGNTLQKAADDTLTRFNAGEESHFTQTPEAVKHLLEHGYWYSEDHKTQYYFKF